MKFKWKKLFALILVCALLLVPCGCASSEDADTEETTLSAGIDSIDDNVEKSVEETSEETVEEPITLRVTCGFSETDLSSRTLEYFCDLVEERSGGSIIFERWLGGTFCSLTEEFGYVSSGATDCAFILGNMVLESLPLWNIALTGYSVDNSNALFDYIYFENEDTATYAEDEATANNVKILGQVTGGATLYLATSSISNFEELSQLTFACDLNSEVYTALGFSVQSLPNSDLYESLSRGVVESVSSGIFGASSNKLYEVAKYVLVGTHGDAGPMLTFNLESFNSLTAEQQAIIEECAQETFAWNVEMYEQESQEVLDDMESSGCTLVEISEEDVQNLIEAIYTIKRDTLQPMAENAGVVEEFNAIYDVSIEYLGLK